MVLTASSGCDGSHLGYGGNRGHNEDPDGNCHPDHACRTAIVEAEGVREKCGFPGALEDHYKADDGDESEVALSSVSVWKRSLTPASVYLQLLLLSHANHVVVVMAGTAKIAWRWAL